MDSESAGDRLREAVGKRTEVLDAITDGTRRKPALVETLHVSRSTVDRAVDELVDAGAVADAGGEFHATTAGELALDAYREYVDRTDAVAAAAPVLSAMPDDAPLDAPVLNGADVDIADPQAPEGALASVIAALGDATELRVFTPVLKHNYITLLHDEVAAGDLSVELLLERSTRESLGQLARGRERFGDLLDDDAVDVVETDRTLPFTLWLLDTPTGTRVGVAVHARDSGGLVGVITNDAPAAVDWCREVYESHASAAEPVPAAVLDD